MWAHVGGERKVGSTCLFLTCSDSAGQPLLCRLGILPKWAYVELHGSQDVYSGGLIDASAVAADWMLHGRFRWLEVERASATFDFPAYVMNLRGRPDRRQHSRALLHAIGFTNIVFPDTISAADLSFGKVIADGWMTEQGLRGLDERVHLRPPHAKRAYVANTIGHLSALRRGLESGSQVFAIFEDDLLPTASLVEVNRRLQHMLRVLTSEQARRESDGSATAPDMLYLEYCYEQCGNVTAADEYLGWAHAPVCTGGIVYSRAGASRVLERCLPIFDGACPCPKPYIIPGEHTRLCGS
jgi:hypothetical protein